jgi:hypothetical protein
MTSGRWSGVIHSGSNIGRTPETAGTFGRKPSVAPGAPEPPRGAQRSCRTAAIGTLWRRSRRPPGGQREHAEPFDLQGGAGPATPPELYSVPGGEPPNDARQRFRGFEGDCLESGPLGIHDAQPHVPSGKRPRLLGDTAGNPSGAVGEELSGRTRKEVVAGSLVGPEQDPSVDRFGTHSAAGLHRGAGVGPPKPEEDRARRVRRDEEASRARVDAEEQAGKVASDGSHRVDVHPAPAPFALDRSVRDELPSDAPAGPGDRGARSDQSSPVPLGMHHGAHRNKVPTGRLDRNDLADRAVVPFGREPTSYRDQCRVRPGLPQSGGLPDSFPGPGDEIGRPRRR